MPNNIYFILHLLCKSKLHNYVYSLATGKTGNRWSPATIRVGESKHYYYY